MNTRAKIITKEHEAYRDSLLKKRTRIKKPLMPQKTTRKEYMDNCLFWINSYFENPDECFDKKRAITAAECLKIYCDQIINELKIKNNDTNSR